MPAVRARRPGRKTDARKGRTSSHGGGGAMPRLAAIKLQGMGDPSEHNISSKNLLIALAGIVLVAGASIAGATWIGGSLFDAGEAFNRSADAAVAGVGFHIEDIEVTGEGVSPARLAEVRSVVAPEGAQSLLALDPLDVKARVEGLDWVEQVSVRRLWPSTLRVDVKRREAFALWRDNGVTSVIDVNGDRLTTEALSEHAHLPLIIGRGAGPAAQPLLEVLEDLPAVRGHLKALVRIGDRRWDMLTVANQIVRLPEQAPEVALARLETLQTEHLLLDRPVGEFDMRVPGRLAVRVTARLVGSEAALAAGGA